MEVITIIHQREEYKYNLSIEIGSSLWKEAVTVTQPALKHTEQQQSRGNEMTTGAALENEGLNWC